jgi:uncharacterized spore protein YtfJ
MASSNKDVRPRLQVRTVRGEPFRVGDRALTPVARVVTFGRASGTVGRDGVSGWGGAFVRITPLALEERTPDGQHSIAVYDAASRVVSGFLAQAAAIVLLLCAVRWLARRVRSKQPAS